MQIRKVIWRLYARLRGKVPCARCNTLVGWDTYMVNQAMCDGCFDQMWCEYQRQVDREIPQWTPFDTVGILWSDDLYDSTLAVGVNGKVTHIGGGYEQLCAILERLKRAGGLNIAITMEPNANVQK